jgi:hypothetical protein
MAIFDATTLYKAPHRTAYVRGQHVAIRVDLRGVLDHFKLALDVSFFVRHENFLHPKLGNLQKVSRDSVHIYMLHKIGEGSKLSEKQSSGYLDGARQI